MTDSAETGLPFQLDELPHADLLACLRQLGTALLEAALNRRPVPLTLILSVEQVRLFESLERSPQKRRAPYSRTIQDVVRDRTSLHDWLDLASVEARRLLQLDGEYAVPEGFWAVLGERAWADLFYRHTAARLLERAIHERTLCMLQGQVDFPTFSLSPRTFWLLLSLAAARVDFGFRDRPQVRRIVQKLQGVGRQIGMQPGWANIWDQWVLLESIRSRPSGAQTAAILQALDSLPLVRLGRIEDSTKAAPDEEQGIRLAQPQWTADMPVWFQDWWLASSSKPSHRKE